MHSYSFQYQILSNLFQLFLLLFFIVLNQLSCNVVSLTDLKLSQILTSSANFNVITNLLILAR